LLSILIPVYAYDVRPLVYDLHQQAQALAVPWEILLLDDASPPAWQHLNQSLGELAGVTYHELPQNSGRAAIRNTLARQAQYDYLLFMDCDSGVAAPAYLNRYLQALLPETVLCGGRTYQATPPPPPFYLHWWYGCQREVKSARERSQAPYAGFMTNNFVVPRTRFLAIGLDERLRQYGHEDTLFGLQLQQAGIPILHLDNPLLHLGLEPAAEWLQKQRQAIDNLYELYLLYPALQTRALVAWRRLHRSGLLRWGYPWLQRQARRWEKQLVEQPKPALHLLDMLKLVWLEAAHRRKYRGYVES